MSDDESEACGQDRLRINTDEDFEVRDWVASVVEAVDPVAPAASSVALRAPGDAAGSRNSFAAVIVALD